ncbi:MAG: DUF3108 domain-containing protein [Bacteriovoracaceae bacterium]|nr:DUF3108 domain-containing protein [Bacteriovoracaceae bacterium]
MKKTISEWKKSNYAFQVMGLILIILFHFNCSTHPIADMEDSLPNSSDESILNDMDQATKQSFEVAPAAAPTAPVLTKEMAIKGKKYAPMKKEDGLKGKKKSDVPAVIAAAEVNPFKHLSQDEKWKEIDQKSYALWSQFSSATIATSEVHKMQVSYLGVVAATTVLTVEPEASIQGRAVYHFRTRAKTSDFYRWVYSLDDVLDSFVDKEFFVPIKYSLKQREKNKDIDDIQLFDRQKLMTYFRYKKIQNGKETKNSKDAPIPFYNQDYLSSFFFLRGLPLKNGDHYLFPTTTKGETWMMSIKVAARENIVINLGKFKAIKLEVNSKYSSDLAKQSTMIFWLSDDDRRMFLRTNAEVKFGSIKSELTFYSHNGKTLYGTP